MYVDIVKNNIENTTIHIKVINGNNIPSWNQIILNIFKVLGSWKCIPQLVGKVTGSIIKIKFLNTFLKLNYNIWYKKQNA